MEIFERSDFGVTSRINLRDIDSNFVIDLKKTIYKEKLVVFKQQDLTPAEFVAFGKQIGVVEKYYEDMYHHKEHEEIFVSSNRHAKQEVVGVPRTGKFWHSDYAFMPSPFAFTITFPQVVPKLNRGTYFIDMAEAYEALSEDLKQQIAGTSSTHSVRKCFKIRPKDLYQPIGAILDEIDSSTPPVVHPTVVTHPITGEKILYISEGFTMGVNPTEKVPNPDQLLQQLLQDTGQLDDTYQHPNIKLLNIEEGDLLLWDNRRFIHHAKHSGIFEPSETYRLTVYDDHEFSSTNAA
jgi:taurine dioxygenase